LLLLAGVVALVALPPVVTAQLPVVALVAGVGLPPLPMDGEPADRSWLDPNRIVVGSDTSLYVSELLGLSNGGRIRQIGPEAGCARWSVWRPTEGTAERRATQR
jgi:hypothetical protein